MTAGVERAITARFMSDILPGTEVHARGLRWFVTHSENLGTQTLYRLRGAEGALAGRELDLLHPFEPIEPVRTELCPERAAHKAQWLVFHQAFLLDQALGTAGIAAVQPGRLRLERYQLVPVLRAIRMSRVRLLLADGVGLGKTVQAGLILTELITRRLAHRILLVTPSGPLLEQWEMEMSHRFGLRFERVDSARLQQVRRSSELGANPFDSLPFAIASVDFLKQERVLELLERASYDAVVIDEAHHCMETGSAAQREDSQRRRLAQVLAARCDSFILATATPHDGNDRSFASLCELLDPSLVDGRGALRGDRYRQHVVRRLKDHIRDKDGSPVFRERDVQPVRVTPDEHRHGPFMEMQRALVALIAPELRRALRARRYADVLAFIALLKRSVSTAFACVRTVEAVAARLSGLLEEADEDREAARQRLRSLRELQRKLDQFGSLSADEEVEQRNLEIEEIAQKLAESERQARSQSRKSSRLADLTGALHGILDLGARAVEHDPKLDAVLAEITAIRAAEPRANVLIYTEYVDSQQALLRHLENAGIAPLLSMNGEDDEDARSRTTDRFRSDANLVLVSTDAAAEGLNLHQRCHHLIHLELPFNPNRLEQRNGRIDRYGQMLDPIVRYLYLGGTFEERILLRLIAKYERQRRTLKFVPNTLGIISSESAGEKLLAGLVEEEDSLFRGQPVQFDTSSAAADPSADAATQELLEEIDRSLHGFRQAAVTHTWLGSAGLNAEVSLADEADKVRRWGEALSRVDLTHFIRDAVLSEGGTLTDHPGEDWFTLTLPPSWVQGMEGTPGFEKGTRQFRLTSNLDTTRTPEGEEIGYLGRAHPLVRRALDRVRHLMLGRSHAGTDPRVSAIEGDAPALLFIFLGRLNSRTGRELERLFVVRVLPDGTVHALPDDENWVQTITAAPGINTDGLWQRHFAAWGHDTKEPARAAAVAAFHPVSAAFAAERSELTRTDNARLHDWLTARCREITADRQPAPQEADLFTASPTTPAPDWSALADPAAKLAAFASDRSQPAAPRSEAETVLRVFRQRSSEITARAELSAPDIVPVGLLMVAPAR